MSTLNKTVLFFNPFEDFTAFWGKEPFTVKKNKKIYMQDWLAKHIRKHLIDRELNRLRLPTDFECADPTDPRFEHARSRMEARCILEEGESTEHGSTVSQELDLLNKENENATHANQNAVSTLAPKVAANTLAASKSWCDSCDSKGVKHKKDCPKNKIKRAVYVASPEKEVVMDTGSFVGTDVVPPITGSLKTM